MKEEKTKNQRTSESVKMLMKEFHGKFESGMTISEIAKEYGVHHTTVYAHLKQIAELNGVSEEYYKRYPQKSHSAWQHLPTGQKPKFDNNDLERLDKSFEKLETSINDVVKEINKVLVSQKETETQE